MVLTTWQSKCKRFAISENHAAADAIERPYEARKALH